jgi:zinc protease
LYRNARSPALRLFQFLSKAIEEPQGQTAAPALQAHRRAAQRRALYRNARSPALRLFQIPSKEIEDPQGRTAAPAVQDGTIKTRPRRAVVQWPRFDYTPLLLNCPSNPAAPGRAVPCSAADRRYNFRGVVMRASLLVLLLSVLASPPARAQEWKVPTAMTKLKNGLVIVVSEQHSAPTFGLCISYGIGFRLEPRGRTGFAHLFEHMMFEGTPRAPKGVFDRVIEEGGGWNNADTNFDFTEYIDTAPISALDPVLWLEADRMKGLAFSQTTLDNQRQVVEEEVRVNVLNQPYGGFYWLDLPEKAFDKFPNAHNFYGDFTDLDAATVDDVRNFFHQYYAPNNAVLAVAGDVTPQEVFAKAEKYFGAIPERPVPPRPDVTEAPQTAPRSASEPDRLAKVPALAIGYRMPPRTSHQAVVAAVAGNLLHNGQASLLYQALVKQKKVALSVDGGVNWPNGNPFEYNGPTLMTSLIVYPGNVPVQTVLAAYEEVIHRLGSEGATPAELQRIRAKMRSDWYGQLEIPVERASALSHATLFDGSPARVNQIPDELARVTSAEIQEFVKKYLVSTNRTTIDRVPASAPAAKPQKGGGQ